MSVLGVLGLCVILLGLPMGAGCFFYRGKRVVAGEVYLTGLCLMFSIYEFLGIFFYYRRWPLSSLTILFSVIMLGLCAAGALPGRRVEIIWQRFDRKEWLLFALLAVIVTAQALYSSLTFHNYMEDNAYYTGVAVTDWYTNTIQQFDAEIGSPYWLGFRWGQFRMHVMWSDFWASCAQITRIHPAILVNSLLTYFAMPLSYYVWYMISRLLWDGDRKKALMTVVFIAIIFTFTSFNLMVVSPWFLFSSWLGKTMVQAFAVPTAIYVLCRLEQNQVNREKTGLLWMWLLLCDVTACFVAGTGANVIIPVLGVGGLCCMIRQKRFQDIWKYAACALPSLVFLAVVYLRLK